MTPPATRQLKWADDQTLGAVRPTVRSLLEASPSYAKLPDDEKRELAAQMVKVASYMANPDGLAATELSEQGGVLMDTRAMASGAAPMMPDSVAGPDADQEAPAQALAEKEDPVTATKRRLSEKSAFAGEDFVPAAVEAGVEQFGELVKKVDFTKFVSGLIKGVFEAIVDSSIEQMRAYGDLLANVAKTIDQFAQDNISENNARDWLAESFPGELGIETSDTGFGFAEGDTPEPAPRLVASGDDPEATARAISERLGMAQPVTDLSDENQERKMVLAARLQMARGRQQLLASMVTLGINRIVVTDGLIHAKVVFDMRASDRATRRARASMFDRQKEASKSSFSAGYGSWYSPVSANVSAESSSEHVTTVQSSVDDTSESKAEVKARLTGEVRVNFKSDYFPMEKLANPQMIAAIQGNAIPPEQPAAIAPA